MYRLIDFFVLQRADVIEFHKDKLYVEIPEHIGRSNIGIAIDDGWYYYTIAWNENYIAGRTRSIKDIEQDYIKLIQF